MVWFVATQHPDQSANGARARALSGGMALDGGGRGVAVVPGVPHLPPELGRRLERRLIDRLSRDLRAKFGTNTNRSQNL